MYSRKPILSIIQNRQYWKPGKYPARKKQINVPCHSPKAKLLRTTRINKLATHKSRMNLLNTAVNQTGQTHKHVSRGPLMESWVAHQSNLQPQKWAATVEGSSRLARWEQEISETALGLPPPPAHVGAGYIDVFTQVDDGAVCWCFNGIFDVLTTYCTPAKT